MNANFYRRLREGRLTEEEKREWEKAMNLADELWERKKYEGTAMSVKDCLLESRLKESFIY